MQVIPAVDVLGGRAVRLMQGDYGRVSEYDSDPGAVARRFVTGGATLVHVVDLDAARGRERSLDVLRSFGASGVPFEVGGGIRTAVAARESLEAGAERVVVGSALLAGGEVPREIVDAVGPHAVVAAIDVRRGRARGSGWLDEGVPLADVLVTIADLGIERALVTGIETDGTMEGPAWELLAQVRDASPDLALIASGGVGSIEDIRALSDSDLSFEAVIVGRALYEGRFTLPEAIEAAL
ncbi:MAG: 1-(5-phosphoribosyl)-5-[(5-phosphoribosylamino) methylideneamino]imidazole-4-carboxamide isomerase [Acidimicrobiia bacterium]|nr:MAG: 1-(5-phosphoribosyl)-5-[(5-phosphoribosylamino) methylideneamino]imidazole-4-carboxamide isomerase [Acidimicrobiia bacterium]